MVYLCGFVAVVWMLFAFSAWWNYRSTPILPELADLPCEAVLPRVSVVIAARNEAARIRQTVQGFLAQQGVDLQLIVVDDRSTDETRAILREQAQADGRLHLLCVDELPAGWLGKCHACYRGAQVANGNWILFTDADIHTQPDVLARAIGTSQRDAADHLVLFPGLNCTGAMVRASVLAWAQFLVLYAPPAQINADRGRKALGIGAFNLVRTSAYRACGGHEPLRMEVIDDVKLGLLLRRAGCKQRVYSGEHLLEAEWAHSMKQVVLALEKNWFAGVEYSWIKGLTVVTVILTFWLLAVLGPWLAGWTGAAAFAGLSATAITGWQQSKRMGWPTALALLVPLGIVLFPITGLHSMWKAWRNRGIRWRETVYPLQELRAGLVR